MTERRIDTAASRARRILGTLGVSHSVGTSWNDHGDAVVVVDVPPSVDRDSVMNKLADIGADVVVRHVTRSIVAH